jgi:16S rRNA (uracil1498-N3)-methyltransferase
VNILLFLEQDWERPLPAGSVKANHLLSILKVSKGDKLTVGLFNTGIGQAQIRALTAEGQVELDFPSRIELQEGPLRFPVHIVLGHPRIPVIQRLFKDFSSMGVSTISVLGTDLSEKSYWESSLWKQEEWKKYLWEGSEQGGFTSVPEVHTFWSVRDFLVKTPAPKFPCYFHLNPRLPFAFPYLLDQIQNQNKTELTIAIGPERGWTDKEIALLDSQQWHGLFLGRGVWRTESVGIFSAGLANHLFSWMSRS